eukprot:2405769-Rhodomonas_salina.2
MSVPHIMLLIRWLAQYHTSHSAGVGPWRTSHSKRYRTPRSARVGRWRRLVPGGQTALPGSSIPTG